MNKRIVLSAYAKEIRENYVSGYTNRCKDGKYIIFLDYDDMPFSWIKEEVKHIQELFDLGNFYIFESSKDSYHCVCFDKVPLLEYVNILRNTSVDPGYVDIPLHFGKKIWTLRVSDKNNIKVRFVGLIKSKCIYNRKSLAHIKFIESHFKDLKIEEQNHDDCEDMIFAKYPI